MKETGLKDIRVTTWPNPPAVAGEKVLRLDYVSGRDGRPDWGVVIPGTAGGDWAVVLHGHGSGGDQLLTRPDIRDLWLPALRSAGLGVYSPNLRGNAWMSPSAAHDLHAATGWLREKYHPRRLFITGGSMGGTSALIYATLHPDEIDGVMALCPATDLPAYCHWARERGAQIPVLGEIASAIESNYGAAPDQSPELYARHSVWTHRERLTMPMALAHGTADIIIPSEPTRRLAQHLHKRPDVRYEELPGGNHDAPIPTFPKALDWILRH